MKVEEREIMIKDKMEDGRKDKMEDGRVKNKDFGLRWKSIE